jgi:hypothetical protein
MGQVLPLYTLGSQGIFLDFMASATIKVFVLRKLHLVARMWVSKVEGEKILPNQACLVNHNHKPTSIYLSYPIGIAFIEDLTLLNIKLSLLLYQELSLKHPNYLSHTHSQSYS